MKWWCDNPITGWSCDVVGDAAGGAFEDMIKGAAEAVLGWAVSVMGWLWGGITATTTPQTDAGFLYTWAGRIFAITLPVTVGFLALQVITVMLSTRSTSGMVGAVARAGAAVVGTSLSLPVIHLLTQAVDGLAVGLTEATFGDLDQLGIRFGSTMAFIFTGGTGGGSPINFALLGGGSIVAGAFAAIVFGFLLAAGSLAVWGALIIRTMLLYIVIVMGPIAIMGSAWKPTRSWTRRWISLVITLIVTKLAVMIVFGLGVSALEGVDFGSDGAGAVGVMLSATLMLLLAGLVPVATFKFLSFVGDEIEAGGLQRAGSAAAAQGKDTIERANPLQMLRQQQSRDGSGGGTNQAAHTRPSRSPSGPASGSSGAASAGASSPGAGSGSPTGGTNSGGSSGAAAAGAVVGAAKTTADQGGRAASHAATHSDSTLGGDPPTADAQAPTGPRTAASPAEHRGRNGSAPAGGAVERPDQPRTRPNTSRPDPSLGA